MIGPAGDNEKLLEAEAIVGERLGGRFDLVSQQAVSNIYRAAASVRREAESTVLSGQNISWGGFTILFVLWVWGETEATALASEANLAKGTLSGMLDTLERRELVVRSRKESDRRRVVVGLTPEGVEVIEEIFPKFNEFEDRVCGELTEAERLELARLLRIVTSKADELFDN